MHRARGYETICDTALMSIFAGASLDLEGLCIGRTSMAFGDQPFTSVASRKNSAAA